MELDDDDAVGPWTLTAEDHALVTAKNVANRLGFALLLLFHRKHGRFPRKPAEIGAKAVERVAQQLGVEPKGNDGYDTTSRTWKRHRAEIRKLLGFREASVADAELLEDWLKDQVAAVGAVPEQLAALLERRCRELSIEPPADDRIDRVVAPRSMRMMNVSSPASWAAWRRRRAGGLKGSCILPQTTPAIRLLISP